MTNIDHLISQEPSKVRRGPAARDDESYLRFNTCLSLFWTLTRYMMAIPRQKVVVVGAGPVGSLAALYAASRGDEVEVYELRGGMFLCLV